MKKKKKKIAPYIFFNDVHLPQVLVFNFAVVMPHRWAGLLSMCRSFLSVLKKKREGEMKRNLLPLPLALIFSAFLR